MLLTEQVKISILGILLFAGVWFDILTKKIPKWYAYFYLATGIICFIFSEKQETYEMIIGGSFGLFFFLVARITKESIGYGDAYIMTGIGFALGITWIFTGLMIALLCMLPISCSLLLMKKVNKKTKIPFLPFLFLGIMVEFVMRGRMT
jgi:leader peptidase (prepilin peptidase)/N-methyltransferase